MGKGDRKAVEEVRRPAMAEDLFHQLAVATFPAGEGFFHSMGRH